MVVPGSQDVFVTIDNNNYNMVTAQKATVASISSTNNGSLCTPDMTPTNNNKKRLPKKPRCRAISFYEYQPHHKKQAQLLHNNISSNNNNNNHQKASGDSNSERSNRKTHTSTIGSAFIKTSTLPAQPYPTPSKLPQQNLPPQKPMTGDIKNYVALLQRLKNELSLQQVYTV